MPLGSTAPSVQTANPQTGSGVAVAGGCGRGVGSDCWWVQGLRWGC